MIEIHNIHTVFMLKFIAKMSLTNIKSIILHIYDLESTDYDIFFDFQNWTNLIDIQLSGANFYPY